MRLGTQYEQEVVQEFAGLVAALAVAAKAVRPEGLTAHGAEQIVDHLIAMDKASAGLRVLLAARAAEGSGWRARGARSPAEDLARRSGTGAGAAREILDTSEKVRSRPALADALQAGKLSERQAAAIADAAAANPSAESSLVDAAAREDLRALRDRCGRVKAAADLDPDATNRRIHRERCLRYGKGPDGAVNGSFKLTPQVGAELDAYLAPFRSAEARRAHAEGRRDSPEAISADALIAMARASAAWSGSPDHPEPSGPDQPGPAQSPPKARTKVYVVVDWEALLRGHTEADERCEMSTSFGPISVPVTVVQEMLHDAFLVGVFRRGTDIQSVIRFGRHIPAAVRDALRVRDDFTCEVPGCGRRARLEVDHHEPRARGGPTAYINLGHKCWHDHQEKTANDRLFDPGPDPPDTG